MVVSQNIEESAETYLRVMLPKADVSDMPDGFNDRLKQLYSNISKESAGVDDTEILSTLPGSAVIHTRTFFRNGSYAPPFIGIMECCIEDVFASDSFFDDLGTPVLLSSQITYLNGSSQITEGINDQHDRDEDDQSFLQENLVLVMLFAGLLGLLIGVIITFILFRKKASQISIALVPADGENCDVEDKELTVYTEGGDIKGAPAPEFCSPTKSPLVDEHTLSQGSPSPAAYWKETQPPGSPESAWATPEGSDLSVEASPDKGLNQ